jgi:predicted  nucleic acid-binding Zn-ribbon protein
MSVIKLNQDIESVEQQLKQLETAICAPIERIEQKKKLERKIKKLRQILDN